MIPLDAVATAILLIALVLAAACGRHFYALELAKKTQEHL